VITANNLAQSAEKQIKRKEILIENANKFEYSIKTIRTIYRLPLSLSCD